MCGVWAPLIHPLMYKLIYICDHLLTVIQWIFESHWVSHSCSLVLLTVTRLYYLMLSKLLIYIQDVAVLFSVSIYKKWMHQSRDTFYNVKTHPVPCSLESALYLKWQSVNGAINCWNIRKYDLNITWKNAQYPKQRLPQCPTPNK